MKLREEPSLFFPLDLNATYILYVICVCFPCAYNIFAFYTHTYIIVCLTLTRSMKPSSFSHMFSNLKGVLLLLIPPLSKTKLEHDLRLV